ncbi:MIP/aquaporin family protein [Aspergillus homomorphus CBS 101889]|uniref:Aquaporin rerated protein n=1 Tax=Aspergillus homomorphus (strain CBS 101889) TaxID=1450537 RepID=A0A395IGV8_ASPHC|nr:aquaporin rerated protein [Aspergillus homomorphus CBS 101889]RAL17434.1 aquaporin rerated protein [Aspergillus homomorphus CBS 101889]
MQDTNHFPDVEQQPPPGNNEQSQSQIHRRRKALKNHLLAASSEFVGTVLFLWFAFAGTQVAAMNSDNDTLSPQSLLYISLSFGMSLLVVAWAFYRISGGLFNPAVTVGLTLSGAMPWLRGVFLLPAQILGGIVAAALVSCMFPGPISVFQTRLNASTSITRGLFIEMFLTTLLVFTILMLAAEKHNATFMAPVGIGLALFVAELAGVYFTGGSLNPARSFGPDVAAASFPGYHYIYWIGPLMGALLAAGYYRFVKAFNYPEANPGQDATDPKDE